MCDDSLSDIFYAKNISWVLLGDEVFVIEEITNNIYLFKDLSKEVWLLIRKTKRIIDIIHQLAERYGVDFAEIKNDIIKILVKFSKNNLIVWSDSR